jgi:hypothetical protein
MTKKPKLGTTVQLNEWWERWSGLTRGTKFVVVGGSKLRGCVTLTRPGKKTRYVFHIRFLEEL